MNRKTQMIIWVAATVVGVIGILIIARSTVTGASATYGIVLLCLTTVLLLITTAAKPGRDKGDAM